MMVNGTSQTDHLTAIATALDEVAYEADLMSEQLTDPKHAGPTRSDLITVASRLLTITGMLLEVTHLQPGELSATPKGDPS